MLLLIWHDAVLQRPLYNSGSDVQDPVFIGRPEEHLAECPRTCNCPKNIGKQLEALDLIFKMVRICYSNLHCSHKHKPSTVGGSWERLVGDSFSNINCRIHAEMCEPSPPSRLESGRLMHPCSVVLADTPAARCKTLHMDLCDPGSAARKHENRL